jgi:hypothetical protein
MLTGIVVLSNNIVIGEVAAASPVEGPLHPIAYRAPT